jgi:phage I-like protein
METEISTDLLAPFLNRAGNFDPKDWFHLVPIGTFPIARKEGDKVKIYQQVVDGVACDRIVGAFANRRTVNPAYQMLVGFEHFAHQENGSSAAAAWVNEVEKRADGVWARGEWTPDGEAAIKNKKYRYLSPVWFPRQTEKIGENRVRPIEVNDAGLTNMPNMGDALKPFWNRADPWFATFHGREATSENKNPSHMKDRLILICGLAATATDDQLVAAVEAYKNRASQFDTLNADHTALKNRHTALLTDSVTKTLDEFKGVITEESKDAWKNRLTDDFPGTVALLRGLKPAPAAGGNRRPVHQPGKGAAAAANNGGATEEVDAQDAFMNRVGEVMASRKLDKADAIAAVAAEEPALYVSYNEAITGRATEE